MIDKVLKSANVESVDLPFPGYTGDIKIKPLNGDYALGPSMIHIRMEPGAVIPAHLHKKAAEVLCIWMVTLSTKTRRMVQGIFCILSQAPSMVPTRQKRAVHF